MSEMGRLFVCATPIGNLDDASPRLVETLGNVDVIYAEDTRRVATLLGRFEIEVRTRSLFAGNESARTEELVADVVSGKRVALVSDAGMPTVSDPGSLAVRRVRESGRPVTVIPGPSAVTMAVALSGFSGDRFVFEGFLPKKGKEREQRLARLGNEDRQVVLFVSPHRLVDDLEDLRSVVGPARLLTVNRELTKLHEEVWSGTVEEAVRHWSGRRVKGELTVVVAPGEPGESDITEGVELARELVKSGSSVSEAAREVAGSTGLSRRAIYQRLIDGQELS